MTFIVSVTGNHLSFLQERLRGLDGLRTSEVCASSSLVSRSGATSIFLRQRKRPAELPELFDGFPLRFPI